MKSRTCTEEIPRICWTKSCWSSLAACQAAASSEALPPKHGGELGQSLWSWAEALSGPVVQTARKHFDPRRTTEAPKVVEKSPRSPGRRECPCVLDQLPVRSCALDLLTGFPVGFAMNYKYHKWMCAKPQQTELRKTGVYSFFFDCGEWPVPSKRGQAVWQVFPDNVDSAGAGPQRHEQSSGTLAFLSFLCNLASFRRWWMG